MRGLIFCLCVAWTLSANAQTFEDAVKPGLVPLDNDYHLGNSLTSDTKPGSLPAFRQWGISGGKSIDWFVNNPNGNYTQSSTPWPDAMAARQWKRVFFQPHYGDEDVVGTADNIETVLENQNDPVIYIHRGWPRRWQWDTPTTVHTQEYIDALVQELELRGWRVVVNDSMAPLDKVRQDILAGQAPFKDFTELWRDATHMDFEYGRFLQHNKLRQLLGKPFDGWETMDPAKRAYLLSVLTGS